MERYNITVKENPFDGCPYADMVVSDDGAYMRYDDAKRALDAEREKVKELEKMYRFSVNERNKLNADMDNLELAMDDKDSQLAALQAQLPTEMPGCTILFKECEKGHGRLTATNWIDHGCGTCTLEQLQAQLAQLATFLTVHVPGEPSPTKNSLGAVDCAIHIIINLQAQIRQVEHTNARLREALDKLARLGNEPYYGNSTGNVIAQQVLADTDVKEHT